jgi:hypothetical protein
MLLAIPEIGGLIVLFHYTQDTGTEKPPKWTRLFHKRNNDKGEKRRLVR